MLCYLLARLRGTPPEERVVFVPALRGIRIARQRRGLFGWHEIDP